MKKTVRFSGADEKTPSKAQYFAWINSTNEGSTEAQTLTNLKYFEYLKREFGMQLDIYAWDAGNLDGASGTYETLDGEKLRRQYPTGYGNCVTAAEKLGIRLGVWGGADGYGNTLEEENARRELLVSLCRDFHFAEFKFDSVCGGLRASKVHAFAKTMEECRKYSPDLVLLNHRNNLGKYQKYATTFLWQGRETYVDVLSRNLCTAPHHRAFAFTRGLPPHLKRLVEDHGVCISSCLDYFEDDLIIQAFNRSLILAPEIYGNPWFLRDDEQAMLARIYNLHRRYRDILIDGIKLPKKYGAFAVSRGNGIRRFLTFSNGSWKSREIVIRIGKEIGLEKSDSVTLISRFPYERVLGIYKWGDKVKINAMPFRANLIEAVRTDEAEGAIGGCDYLTIKEEPNTGRPVKIKVIASDGELFLQEGYKKKSIYTLPKFNYRENAPRYLGRMRAVNIPENDRKLYETAMFAVDNDSFERQSVVRSGASNIPEVNNARDAFFNQATYKLRGCDSSAIFDSNSESFFDGRSKSYLRGYRVDGGCLRVDLGAEYYVDNIEIEYFEPSDGGNNDFAKNIEYSVSMDTWKTSKSCNISDVCKRNQDVVVEKVHNIISISGLIKRTVFEVKDNLRYFMLAHPMNRIFNVKAMVEGKEISLKNPKANNLMAPYASRSTKSCQQITIDIPKDAYGKFIAIACEGIHGKEGVYVAGECHGRTFGCFDRAPSFPNNVWEHVCEPTFLMCTYYMKVDDFMLGKKLTLSALFNSNLAFIPIDVYMCASHDCPRGIELQF